MKILNLAAAAAFLLSITIMADNADARKVLNGVKMNGLKFNGNTLNGPNATNSDQMRVTEDSSIQEVQVIGASFALTTVDGRVLENQDLVGAVFDLSDGSGQQLQVRIADVFADPEAPENGVFLHVFQAQDASGQWQDICGPGPDGHAAGFPLTGAWSEDGTYQPTAAGFTVTCTSGVIGKCVRMGYKPWESAADGTSLLPYFQACTRMMRADYCGDGVPHTKNGTTINIYDVLAIQSPDETPDMAFEAAWGVDGALCLRHTRWPDVASLEEVVAQCPGKLANRTGAAMCSEAAMSKIDQALIMNQSVDRN